MGTPRHAKARQLTQLVLECARCCRPSLIVIDDIHLLGVRREADRDANNHLKRLANDLQPERAMWLGVLHVFERELVLLHARTGDLTGQADYLWRRTQGVIGSLTQLLTEATGEAIDTGAERITPGLLDGIDVGYAAEVGAGRQPPQRSAV